MVVMAKYEITEMIVAVERYGVTKIPAAPPVMVKLLRVSVHRTKEHIKYKV